MKDTIVALLSDYSVISIALAGAVGFLVGSVLTTFLWLRWWLAPDDMHAIETYANKSWGD
jgi:hypothetical protein